MTKFFIALTALAFLTLTACNEEVTLSTKYKETPVIFCLLDQSEDIHFVKINRGFIGPGDALQISQIPDSNYFETVSGKVEEILNNTVVRTWELQDTLLTTKDTNGVFFGPEQKVYYFDNGSTKLNTAATYRLTVDINEGKVVVVGETKLVSGFASAYSLSSETANLKFAKEAGKYATNNLFCSAGTAAFGSISLQIDIAEIRGTDTTFIQIPWKIGEVNTLNNNLTVNAEGQTFYQLIKAGITNDNTITRRNLIGIHIQFIGGAPEFNNYILVNKPSSSLTQTKPQYTNLSVTDGYKVVGLFSARNTFTKYKGFVVGTAASIRCIDQNTTRELCEGAICGTSLFCSQHPSDIGSSTPKSYACQ